MGGFIFTGIWHNPNDMQKVNKNRFTVLKLYTVLRIRIRDPVPFGPLDPGSGIGFFRIPDQTINF